MNKLTIIIMLTTAIVTGCDEGPVNVLNTNTFDTPFGVPPFEQIRYADYVPAFEKTIKEAEESIKLIVGNRNEPTFQNTIIPLDRREEHYRVLCNIFLNLSETEKCDTMTTLGKTILPMMTKFGDNLYLNKDLFNRVKTLYDKRDSLNLDSAQMRVLTLYYRDFVRNGALLSDADQEKLRSLNEQISLLMLNFGNNMVNETNNSFRLVIDTISDLAGLPENVVEAAAITAKQSGLEGKWVFTLHNASLMPFLQYSERHELRKTLFDAYCMRGNNGNEYDNKENVKQLAILRAQRAKLLGYKSHAHYITEENLASTPEKADSLLKLIWEPAIRKAKSELQEMQRYAWLYNHTTSIEACDWWYWAEKLRKAKYDISEQEISQYFELNNVLQKGVFGTANKLYGVTFERIDNIPHYNADNVVYQVKEANGDYLGLIYFDFHPRSTKSGGAWCTYFQEPIDNFDGTHTPAQVGIVCNFTKPTTNKPALLTFDEVETIFHEFGHSLQFLFTKGQYRRTAGVVPNDYVEMPSQIMEHWASEPEVLKSYAIHYQTQEPISDALIDKIRRSKTFNMGFATVEYLAASLLDLKWHTISPDTKIDDVNDFEAQAMKEIGLINEIKPRYRSTYFAHIFNGGYSANYFVYLWSELLDCDAFAAFTETGNIFNQQVAQSFRKHCLSEVGINDTPMNQYLKFRGKEPDINYLLKKRGLE